jgi:hypothetical protein
MIKEPRMEDKQLKAMQKVVEAFKDLDDAELKVILGWIGMRWGTVKPAPADLRGLAGAGAAAGGNGLTVPVGTYATFPDLYHAADPATEADKALVAGYWIQVSEQKGEFDSYRANSSLKEMGYTVSNITRAFDELMAKDPKYVMQVKKTGTSKQARKTFKLTTAGIKRVAEMLQPRDE